MRFFDRALDNGRSIRVRTTDRSDGDFAIGGVALELEDRRRHVIDRPWLWLHQVHGAEVVVLDDRDIDVVCGESADASVTGRTDVALSIQTADCVPIALWSDDGVIAAAHAGWRGLEAGVIEAAVTELRSQSAASLHAFVGPSIGPECYEFGDADLDRLVNRYGAEVRSETTDGRPALDVRSGVHSELARLGVVLESEDIDCTACNEQLFSHRARAETQRQAMVVWIEES